MLSRTVGKCLRRVRPGPATSFIPRAQIARIAPRRGYASNHSSSGTSSELPWIIGSVTITVSGAGFLLTSGKPKPDSRHGDESDHSTTAPKDEEAEPEKEAEPSKEANSTKEKSTIEDSKSEESDDDSSSEGAATPDSSSDIDVKSTNNDHTEQKQDEEELKQNTVKRDSKPKQVGPEDDQKDGANKKEPKPAGSPAGKK